jgi:acetyltransferase
VEEAVDSGREWLTEPEAKALLTAYGIAVVETRVAADVTEAVSAAKTIGYPVVLKILSLDITHKSDVGGVALNLENAEDVRDAARGMLKRVAAQQPNARVSGFSVQSMVRRPRAHELIAGASVDPLFGPVILFGQGGTAVEVVADRALALPPLSVPLARELVARTRVARLLAGYRDRPRADLAAIYRTLDLISQLVIDLPQIVELDINPLLADERGVIALDARVRVERAQSSGYERLAIRPYPRELEERIEWNASHVLLRPICPEDTAQHLRFLENLDPEDIRMRIFHSKRYFAPSELARLTQIDYEREMAFVAAASDESGEVQTLGVVRTVTDPENASAEFGLIVRSDLKGKGLGRILLAKMIRYCRARGTRMLVGEVLKNNHRMLGLARELGFTRSARSDADTEHITLPLCADGPL